MSDETTTTDTPDVVPPDPPSANPSLRTHDLSVDLTGLSKPDQITALKLEGHDATAYDKFGKVAAFECLIVTDDGKAFHGTIYLG